MSQTKQFLKFCLVLTAILSPGLSAAATTSSESEGLSAVATNANVDSATQNSCVRNGNCQQTLERLATGLHVNIGKDDPAGLSK